MVSPSRHLEAPVAKPRIQALDVIRGLSILGILAVNADGFAAPQAASLKPALWLFPNVGWTATSYWIMDTFFHEKFLTLFSMLFGVSLFLVGGDGSDRYKSRFLARRLVILFAFGMLHGFGIWWGDILSLYAVTGALMYFARSWRAPMLLVSGLALYGAVVVSLLIATTSPPSSPQVGAAATTPTAAAPAITSSIIADRKAHTISAMQIATTSWAEAYRLNAREYLKLLSGDVWLIPQTLALMMIGLSLFKSGFLAGGSDVRRYQLLMAVGAPALAIVGWLCWRADVLGVAVRGNQGLVLLLSPVVSLAYASVLVLILRTRFGRLLAPLAATGRMAFTNYLTQSIIMTSIFYGGRGALMGEVDRPGLWAITAAVWALQLLWSPWWLARFDMGPLEWVWRCLTLGRKIPLRRVGLTN